MNFPCDTWTNSDCPSWIGRVLERNIILNSEIVYVLQYSNSRKDLTGIPVVSIKKKHHGEALVFSPNERIKDVFEDDPNPSGCQVFFPVLNRLQSRLAEIGETSLVKRKEGGMHPLNYKVGPPFTIAKLVYNSNFTMVYGTYNYSYWGL